MAVFSPRQKLALCVMAVFSPRQKLARERRVCDGRVFVARQKLAQTFVVAQAVSPFASDFGASNDRSFKYQRREEPMMTLRCYTMPILIVMLLRVLEIIEH